MEIKVVIRFNSSSLSVVPMTSFLIFILVFLFFLVDLEVAKVVGLLVRCDDTQPIAEVVLLQVLLGQVFKVPVSKIYEEI